MENKYEYSKTTLDNGLDVIIEPRPNRGVVRARLAVLSGPMCEDKEQKGMFHLLEHLLSISTENYPEYTQASKRIKRKGGYINLSTRISRVLVKGEVIPTDLDTLMESFFDIMFRSKLKGIEKERKRAIDEFKNRLGDKSNVNYFKALKQLYKNYYRHGIIGDYLEPKETVENIKSWEKKELEEIYNDVFHPENASLALVGPVKKERILEKIQEISPGVQNGKIYKKPQFKKRNKIEPVREEIDSETAYLDIVADAPNHSLKTQYIFKLVNAITAGHPFSKLSERFKKDRGVYSISSSSHHTENIGDFSIYLETSRDVEKLLEEITEFLRNIESNVSRGDIEKYRDMHIKGNKRYRDRLYLEASNLNVYNMEGDLEGINKYEDRLKEVTYEEVMDTVNNYLAPEKLAVSIMK